MAAYNIYQGDTLINTIESDEENCKAYCASNAYTYKLREDTPPSYDVVEEPEYDDIWAEIANQIREGVNEV